MSSALFSCRNMIYRNCRRLSMTGFTKNNAQRFIELKELKLDSVPLCRTSMVRRSFNTQSNPDSDDESVKHTLMDYPMVWMPSLLRTLKCWITFKLLPSLDKDFVLTEFIEGAQQAVCLVSDALSREDYDSLDGLVTPETIQILRTNVSKLSAEQKREIALQKKECHIYFPYDISVRNGTKTSTKIVEVIMVFHFLRNWKDAQDVSRVIQSDSTWQRLEYMNETMTSPDYPHQTIVCNYRFIREFDDSDKSWFIDVVNQFKLCDAM